MVSQIILGDDEHIRSEKWQTKEELEEKILSIVAEVTGMKNVEDVDGFNASLGGEKMEYATFFNVGSEVYK